MIRILPILLIASSLLVGSASAQLQGTNGLGKPLPDPNWLDASKKPTHKLDVLKIVTRIEDKGTGIGAIGNLQ